MTIDTVSDIFAFVLAEGQFSESVLFAKNMPEELKPEEKRAIDAVLGHVRASYIALLSACRQAVLSLAADDPKTTKTLEQNWNRDNTLWERGQVQLPLVVKQSWNAWLTIGLWPREKEPKEPIALYGHLGVQQRYSPLLVRAAGANSSTGVSPDGITFKTSPVQPKQGDRFEDLGKLLVSDLWPVAREVRQLIVAAKGPTPAG